MKMEKNITIMSKMSDELLTRGKIPYFTEQPPTREWLMDHLLPKGQVVLLAGLGAQGKTTLALQLLLHLAFSIDFRDGLKTNTPENFKALLLTAEDDKTEIHSRIRRIGEHFVARGKIQRKDLPSIENNITTITDDIAPDWWSALSEIRGGLVVPTLSSFVLRNLILSRNYTFIIIDALTSTFAADFNNMSHMQSILKTCRELTKNGATVLIVHHMNKNALNNITSFDALLSACFGSIGAINRIRHNLILYKNVLFVGKSNLTQEIAIRLRKDEKCSFYETTNQDIIKRESFDIVIENMNCRDSDSSSSYRKTRQKAISEFDDISELDGMKDEEDLDLVPKSKYGKRLGRPRTKNIINL